MSVRIDPVSVELVAISVTTAAVFAAIAAMCVNTGPMCICFATMFARIVASRVDFATVFGGGRMIVELRDAPIDGRPAGA